MGGAKLKLLYRGQPLMLKSKTKDRRKWVELGMKEVEKGQSEGETDWVSQEKDKLGRDGTPKHKEWIAETMTEGGDEREFNPMKARKIENSEKNADKIARDLDVTRKGEYSYSDIYSDMEKTGTLHSEENRRIAADMAKTGRRTGLNQLAGSFNDITYKIDDWKTKAFDIDAIAQDMKDAGKAEDQDWISRDVEVAGEAGTDKARKLPAQRKELCEPIDNNLAAHDMIQLLKADQGLLSSKEWTTEHEMNKLVAEDMTLVGQSSESWVKHDLEMIGHSQGSSLCPSEAILDEVEGMVAAKESERQHEQRGFWHVLKHLFTWPQDVWQL